MPKIIPLEAGNFYHIYNHGVGGRNLFREKGNYEHFLRQYRKYIDPVVDTYAWALMPNHFHWLVRVKEDVGGLEITPDRSAGGSVSAGRRESAQAVRGESGRPVRSKPIHQHFSNFFNSYTKAFNKYYNTYGTLFERPFRRKLVDSEAYRNRLLVYVHNNPVIHGFCRHPLEYSWTSYINYMKDNPSEMQREVIEDWFGGKANFKYMHGEELAERPSFEPFWD